MSQSEIFDILKNKRLSGDESFFSSSEIKKLLKDNGFNSDTASLHHSLMKLRQYGFLEFNIRQRKGLASYNNYVYRVKKQYL